MFFLMVFVFLEALTFVIDPVIKKKTGYSDRSVLFLGQSLVFSIAAFLPLFGIPFLDLKSGGILVEGELAWGGLAVGGLFFCMGIAFRKTAL